MKCANCENLIPIDGFGGYRHYDSTEKAMELNVKNGFYTVTERGSFETTYKCNCCGTVWKLAKPDFPALGYFIEEKKENDNA